MDHKTKGIEGEAIAKQHYENLGCEILEVNYRYKRSEIDLVVLQNEEVLIFVEVKFRSSNAFGEPESFVTEGQMERIKTAAEDYIFAINWNGDLRFDIVSIDAKNNLEVFEDAF